MRPCYNSIYRNLYEGQSMACNNPPVPGSGTPSTNGFIYGQNLITKVIERYILEGGDLASTESTETNGQLSNIISNICQTTPGLCTVALNTYCVNVNNETLIRNPNLLKWCGCYMSQENYAKYTNLYGITRECTPTYNMQGVIPIATNDGNSYKICTQNQCIIDDVSINIAKSIVGNSGQGISFSQICNSCTIGGNSGTCNCSLTNANFNIINSQTGNLNISQQCSAQSICYSESTDINGNKISNPIPCTGSNGGVDQYTKLKEETKANYDHAIFIQNIIILCVFIAFIILIVIIWWISSIYFLKETSNIKKFIIPKDNNKDNPK